MTCEKETEIKTTGVHDVEPALVARSAISTISASQQLRQSSGITVNLHNLAVASERWSAEYPDLSTRLLDLSTYEKRQVFCDTVRELFSFCLRVEDLGNLGVAINGFAGLLHPALRNLQVLILSERSTKIPRLINRDLDLFFEVGMLFFDRSGQYTDDLHLPLGTKNGPSSQGPFLSCQRLHLITAVTKSRLYTTTGALNGGRGMLYDAVDPREFYLYLHLLDRPDVESQYTERGGDNSPHASLEADYLKGKRRIVHHRCHFNVLTSMPHNSTLNLEPIGKLTDDSWDLFRGVKAAADNPDKQIYHRLEGMDVREVVNQQACLRFEAKHGIPRAGRLKETRVFSTLVAHIEEMETLSASTKSNSSNQVIRPIAVSTTAPRSVTDAPTNPRAAVRSHSAATLDGLVLGTPLEFRIQRPPELPTVSAPQLQHNSGTTTQPTMPQRSTSDLQ